MSVSLSLLAAAVLAISPLRADVMVGAPGDPGAGDCAPFGCPNDAVYQQIYSSSLFSGPISITGLSFFVRNFDHASFGITPTIYPANYTITFSIVSIPVDGLDPTVANNINPDLTKTQLFFAGALGDGSTVNDHFTISQNQGNFLYDPSVGNLLMQVTTDGTNPAFDMFMDVDRNYDQFGVAFDSDPHPAAADCNLSGANGIFAGGDTTGCTQANYGLVTEFETEGPNVVPEPDTWILLGTVLALLGIAYRTRGQAVKTQGTC